jgi:ketosteroid isomerase-like protein
VRRKEIAMTTSPAADVIRRSFDAFNARDRKTMESLLAKEFTFTSPYDDHINKAAYFDRCWPSDPKVRVKVQDVVADGSDAFVLYEVELGGGKKFRNTEHMIVEGGQIRSTEVYFGTLPEKDQKDKKQA